MSILSRLTGRNDSVNALFRRSAKIDGMLLRAEKKREIKDVLEKYSLNLEGGRLSVTRGYVVDRNTSTIDQIIDIYWRLKASGAGEEIARLVITDGEYLTRYLEMKADDVSDIELAVKLLDICQR